MKLPKHQDPLESRREATAPYNFVPLPEVVVSAEAIPPQDQYHPDRYSGYLDCTLTTLTPLYTRCMMAPEFFQTVGDRAFYDLDEPQKQERARFFHLDDIEKPVIPGSSLRGMVRSLVEILGYGKIQPVTQERLVYRGVGDTTSFGLRYRERLMREDKKNYFTPLMRAGYMEKNGDGWSIRPAQVLPPVTETTFARIVSENVPDGLQAWHGCKNARRIWVKPGPYEYKKVRHVHIKYSDIEEISEISKSGLVEAVRVRSGHIDKKKHDMVIFPPDASANPIPIPADMVITYQEQISQEQEKLLGENGVLREKQPVFYLMENDKLVFFSHTKMLRLPYLKSPNEFVPALLRSMDKIDLAEAIFGYIGLDVDQEAQAGRVFFSDATLKPKQHNIFLANESITPRILSGPKATSFQHYLVQQEPDSQVVGKKKDGRPRTQVFLTHYASATPNETVIRGHKLYWHQRGEIAKNDIEEQNTKNIETSPKQYTRIQPVKDQVTFRFKVHFENLSEAELGALLWALDLPPGHHHKLGMGKPLGMGSVKIEPHLFVNRREMRYRRLFAEDNRQWQTGFSEDEADKASFKQSFEDFVVDRLKNEGIAQGNSLNDQTRIQELLRLMSWDRKPPREKTEYMGLKRFEKRPVLPTPAGVMGDETGSQPRQGQSGQAQAATTPSPAVEVSEPDYPINSTVLGNIVGTWQKGRIEVELETGEKGFLKESRKTIKNLTSKTVKLIVDDFKNGIYYFKLR